MFFRSRMITSFLVRDFKADKNNTNVDNLFILCNLKHSIKFPIYYKSFDKPSVIDVMLTNAHPSFQNSRTIETALSPDFHKMTLTVLKYTFKIRA